MKFFVKCLTILCVLSVMFEGQLSAQDESATNTVASEQSTTNAAPAEAAAPAETPAPTETSAPTETPTPATPAPPAQETGGSPPAGETAADQGASTDAADKAAAAVTVDAVGIVAVILIAVYVVVPLLIIISMWKIYTKAGQPGWASIVPIYNLVILCKITGKPMWWIIMCLIPFVNIIFVFLLILSLARSFGKDMGFGIGLIFLGIIFFPILAFGKSQYVGPDGNSTPPSPATPPSIPPPSA